MLMIINFYNTSPINTAKLRTSIKSSSKTCGLGYESVLMSLLIKPQFLNFAQLWRKYAALGLRADNCAFNKSDKNKIVIRNRGLDFIILIYIIFAHIKNGGNLT